MKESYVISKSDTETLKRLKGDEPIWTDDFNQAVRYDEKPYIQLANINAKEEIAYITTVHTENVTRSSMHQ